MDLNLEFFLFSLCYRKHSAVDFEFSYGALGSVYYYLWLSAG